MKPEFYLALITMHGTIMVFFVISLALVSGMGNFVIPLQVGARDMAFPILSMLSFWTVLARAVVLLASFAVEGGAPAAGWTAYPPLSAVRSAVPGSLLGPDALDRRHGAVHRLLHHGRRQLHRDDSRRARQRHVAVPHAAD